MTTLEKEPELITSIENEIEENLKAIKKLKRLIPMGILVGLLFTFFCPPMILSSGKPSDMPYSQSVIMRFIIFFGGYIYSYRIAVKKRKTNIENLKQQVASLKRKG